MRGGRRMVPRLAGCGVLALLLAAGCTALAPEGPGNAAGPAPATTASPATAASAASTPRPVAPASLPLPPGLATEAASGPAGDPVLGIVGDRPPMLVRLDSRSLRPLPGRWLRLDGSVAGYGWSPDRSVLALGDSDESVLHLVDVGRMRLLGKVRLGAPGAPQWFAWLGPRRLVAVAEDSPGDPAAEPGESSVLLVDPLSRRVLQRRRLEGRTASFVVLRDRVVMLTTPVEGIGTARLAVADGHGRVRAVPLRAIAAGFKQPADWSDGAGEERQAGLAVDPAGDRAFVVAAGVPVAEVDLDDLGVTYRGLSRPASLLRRLAGWLVPPVEAKMVSGPLRSACWLGDGLLAVWGSDRRVVKDAAGNPGVEETPAGLKLVDTRDWSVRQVHPSATSIRWRGGRLLVYGVPGYSEPEEGIGLTLYGPGGRPAVRLFRGRPIGDVWVNGDLAYVVRWEHDLEKSQVAVVDLHRDRVISRRRGLPPYLLLPGEDRAAC
jgi:hypothetical protein